MNRRNFFKSAALGTGAIVVTGSGIVGWRSHETGLLIKDDSPFAPWDVLENLSDHDPRALAAGAILASNPHNTQPWKIVTSDERFELHADTDRNLGKFDPFRREMWLGLGAAIGNAEVVGSAFGFQTGDPSVTDIGSNGSGVISLDLSKGDSVADPLFSFIKIRKTNRAAYQQTSVPSDFLARAVTLAGNFDNIELDLFDSGSKRGKLFAAETVEATKAINQDKEMSHDGHVWFRGNARKIAKYRDGVSVATAGLSPAITILGQLLPEADLKKSGEYWLASTERQVTNAGGFGLITVNDLYDREQQIAAGQLWQRLHLAFTKEGIVAQPMNQMPELVDRDIDLGVDRGWHDRLFAIAGEKKQATFAFRYGFPTVDVPHSARRPIEWVMKNKSA